MPSTVVTSSRMQRRTSVDLDAGDRGVVARVVRTARDVDVHRRALDLPRGDAEDRVALPFVDRTELAREVEVDRQPVIPRELEHVDAWVVMRRSEAWQPRLLEHRGEAPLDLAGIHRYASVFHELHRH
jgi:hypothetical protein